MHRLISSFTIIFLLLTFANGLAFADEYYYSWKDKEGTTHVTDDLNEVPAEYKNSSRKYKKNNKNYKKIVINYAEIAKNSFPQYKLHIFSILGLIILFLLYKLFNNKIRNNLLTNKITSNEKLILRSGIGQMTAHQFKLKVSELLKDNGYRLDDSIVEYNPVVDYIAEKNGKNHAVSINLNSNSIPRIIVTELEVEKDKYDCKYSMIIARTTFDEEALSYAKKVNCKLYDIYNIAKILLKKEKF